MVNWRILTGDVREKLDELPDASVQCVVTSPPYWGLRDYGHLGQIGLEPTHQQYISAVASLFGEAGIWRILRDDGTLWLNLGDSYAGSWGAQSRPNGNDVGSTLEGGSMLSARQIEAHPKRTNTGSSKNTPGLKPKDLVGVPWLVAPALQSRGWYLRSDIIWSKPNPMPESVTDRPTKAHEYIFLLTKSPRYYYDAAAIRNPPSEALLQQVAAPYAPKSDKAFDGTGAQHASNAKARILAGKRDKQRGHSRRHAGFNDRWDQMTVKEQMAMGSNARTVWSIPTRPYPEAHFATFPEELPTRCILAGSREGDTVLDPFCGSGTTGSVAVRLQRNFIGVELNPAYVELARKRIGNALPMFAQEIVA